MGASTSRYSAAHSAARDQLGAAACDVLDAAFGSASDILDEGAFCSLFVAGGLGRRLFASLQAGATAEAVTLLAAAMSCGSDAGVKAFASRLASRDSSPEPFLADLLAYACGQQHDAAPPSVLASLHSCVESAASVAALRAALFLPRPPRPAPLCPDLDARGVKSSFVLLSAAHACVLSRHLPLPCRQRWALLYSRDAHGSSFRTLSSKVSDRGACLVLIRDSSGRLAAGFSDVSLSRRAAFAGGWHSLVASLLPTFEVYPAVGNTNCLWFAERFQSVPCGLGFGGQVGHHAVFVDESLDEGGEGEEARGSASASGGCRIHHSRATATYRNPPLLGDASESTGSFGLSALEVWGVDCAALGEAEEAAARAAKKAAAAAESGTGASVLDARAADRSFMATATGRAAHSDGHRE